MHMCSAKCTIDDSAPGNLDFLTGLLDRFYENAEEASSTREPRWPEATGATPYRTRPNGAGERSKTSIVDPAKVFASASAAYMPAGPLPTTANR